MEDRFNIVFERLKEAKLDGNILCSDFWRRIISLRNNFNEADCWGLMIGNIEWIVNTGTMTTDDIVSWFTKDELEAHGIYFEGRVNVVDGKAIGLKNVHIFAAGHSRVVLFDNASCEAYDTTFVTGFNDSGFVVTDCIGTAMGNCTSEAKGLSIVENWTTNTVKKGVHGLVVERYSK